MDEIVGVYGLNGFGRGHTVLIGGVVRVSTGTAAQLYCEFGGRFDQHRRGAHIVAAVHLDKTKNLSAWGSFAAVRATQRRRTVPRCISGFAGRAFFLAFCEIGWAASGEWFIGKVGLRAPSSAWDIVRGSVTNGCRNETNNKIALRLVCSADQRGRPGGLRRPVGPDPALDGPGHRGTRFSAQAARPGAGDGAFRRKRNGNSFSTATIYRIIANEHSPFVRAGADQQCRPFKGWRTLLSADGGLLEPGTQGRRRRRRRSVNIVRRRGRA